MAHLFVIEITYTASLALIDDVMDLQRTWLDHGYESGVLLASGREVPRKGLMVLATGQSRAELERFLDSAPLVEKGYGTYAITEFVPVKTCAALAHLQSDK